MLSRPHQSNSSRIGVEECGEKEMEGEKEGEKRIHKSAQWGRTSGSSLYQGRLYLRRDSNLKG